MTRAFRLPALVAMTGNGLVQLVVRAGNAALAIVVIGPQKRRCGEHQKASQRCGSKRGFPEEGIAQTMSHRYCVLLGSFRFLPGTSLKNLGNQGVVVCSKLNTRKS